MRFSIPSFLLLSFLASFTSPVANALRNSDHDVKEIERRREAQIKNMLYGSKKKLDLHEAGKVILEDHELEIVKTHVAHLEEKQAKARAEHERHHRNMAEKRKKKEAAGI